MLKRFLRRAVVAGLVVGPFAVAACGSSASSDGFGGSTTSSGGSGSSSSGSGSTSGSGSSSSGTGSSSGSSGSFGDGGMDGSVADTGAPDAPGVDGGRPPTSLVFVHASPSLPSLRLCFGNTPNFQPPFPVGNEMPASNYAGIPVGGAVSYGEIDENNFNSVVGPTVYALRAKLIADLAQGQPCFMLLCQGCWMPNADYWPVGTIDPSKLREGVTNVIAISGCLGADDPLASADRCGPTWNAATGNLHLDVLPLSPTGDVGEAGGPLMVQAAQLSPGLQTLEGDGGAAVVTFGSEGDASVIAELDREGDLLPSSPAPVTLPGSIGAYGQLGFGVDVPGAGANGAGHLWMSLAQSQQLVSPAVDPGVYYGGGPYVVAVVGDPNAPHAFGGGDGGYDGKGLHLLVLPTAGQAPP